jgi:hypothetical protein
MTTSMFWSWSASTAGWDSGRISSSRANAPLMVPSTDQPVDLVDPAALSLDEPDCQPTDSEVVEFSSLAAVAIHAEHEAQHDQCHQCHRRITNPLVKCRSWAQRG